MRIYQALGFSLLVHFLLSVAAHYLPPPPVHTPSVIELVEQSPQSETLKTRTREEQTITRKALAPEDLKSQEKKKARFLSEDDQRVKQEMRARDSGLTANRDGKDRVQEPEPQQSPKHTLTKNQDKKADDSKFKPNKQFAEAANSEKIQSDLNGDISAGRKDESREESKEINLPLMDHFARMAGSTVGERLPDDIQVGNFTALNTDRYLYYSFFARVEELVRHRWVRNIRYYEDKLVHGRNGLKPGNYNSRIEFILDPKGHYIKGLLRDTCGVKEFDLSAIAAFKEAGLFPNPPAEMVQEDGYIHLEYVFQVTF